MRRENETERSEKREIERKESANAESTVLPCESFVPPLLRVKLMRKCLVKSIRNSVRALMSWSRPRS